MKILFYSAIGLALLGGLIIHVGISNHFWRPEFNRYVIVGASLLAIGILGNAIAFVWGAINIFSTHQFMWWWVFSLLFLLVSAIGMFMLWDPR